MTLDLPIVRLRGTQQEMGRQLGEQLLEIGGYEKLLAYYPTMPGRLLTLGLTGRRRRVIARAVNQAMKGPMTTMHRARVRKFPQYVERNLAMIGVAGLEPSVIKTMVCMDLFQNGIGLAGRLGALPYLPVAGVGGCCTSLAVWGSLTEDGRMLHARNFDFPGVNVWDTTPIMTLCDPDEGVRYGYITTVGADVPITSFNEAGLCLSAHTRFHKSVSFTDTSIIDLCHDIIRRAETLDDARKIAEEVGSASTWGIVISSSRERAAGVLEMHSDGVELIRGRQDAASCANRYLAPSLQPGEVAPGPDFIADTDRRHARFLANIDARRGGEPITADDIEQWLASSDDVGAKDRRDGVVRLMGNTVITPMTVQSVVFEPELQQVRVGVTTAPTCWGPYQRVPWDWDGPVGRVEVPVVLGEDHAPEHAHIYREYTQMCHHQVTGGTEASMHERVHSLVQTLPEEPHLQLMAAWTCCQKGDLAGARRHLDAQLALEDGPYRRGQGLLWLSRVLDAAGSVDAARDARHELNALVDPYLEPFQAEAREDAHKPWTKQRLRKVAIHWMLVGAEG